MSTTAARLEMMNLITENRASIHATHEQARGALKVLLERVSAEYEGE
jgi:hypothetical protein